MTPDEPFSLLADSLDMSNLRIRRFPKLVFLCGGPLDATLPNGHSARGYFHSYLRDNDDSILGQLVLAEQIKDWSVSGEYRDLLELEQHLAHLASLVLLFVEGPGSIAELGVFSILSPIHRKILVVLQSHHDHNESFIGLGPVRRLRNLSEESVICFPWEYPPHGNKADLNTAVLPDVAAELLDVVRNHLDDEDTERAFCTTDPGHQILLLAGVIDLSGVATVADLARAVASNDVVPRRDMEKYLYILEKLRYVWQFKYSGQRYYISTGKSPGVRLAFKESAPEVRSELWRERFRRALFLPGNVKKMRAFRASVAALATAEHGDDVAV